MRQAFARKWLVVNCWALRGSCLGPRLRGDDEAEEFLSIGFRGEDVWG